MAGFIDRQPVKIPRSSYWTLGIFAVIAMFLATPMGPRANQLALLVVLVAIFYAVIQSKDLHKMTIPMLSFVLAAWWLLLLANPNVINLDKALIGYRGTVVFVLGIVLGYLWIWGFKSAFIVIWSCILAACVASMVLYFVFPQVEAGFARAADVTTSSFQGQRRMQGIFAGPFHVSLAGAFLTLSSLRMQTLIPRIPIRLFGFLIGIFAVVLAQVRSGIVSIVIGALILAVLVGPIKSRVKKLYIVAVVAVLVVAFPAPILSLLAKVPAAESILGFETDSRLLNREDTWRRAVEMIVDSPYYGWGPGSAGATLAPFFPPGGHVTSHNLLLKYGVEGGVIGILLIGSILVICIKRIKMIGDPTGLAFAALTPLVVFGAIGSTVDALPVSFALAVVIGICARGSYKNGSVARASGSADERTSRDHAGVIQL